MVSRTKLVVPNRLIEGILERKGCYTVGEILVRSYRILT